MEGQKNTSGAQRKQDMAYEESRAEEQSLEKARENENTSSALKPCEQHRCHSCSCTRGAMPPNGLAEILLLEKEHDERFTRRFRYVLL